MEAKLSENTLRYNALKRRLPGNVHDSMVFDAVYEAVTDTFNHAETAAVETGYKTPWICKMVQDDGRNLSTAYKRPMSNKATT